MKFTNIIQLKSITRTYFLLMKIFRLNLQLKIIPRLITDADNAKESRLFMID